MTFQGLRHLFPERSDHEDLSGAARDQVDSPCEHLECICTTVRHRGIDAYLLMIAGEPELSPLRGSHIAAEDR